MTENELYLYKCWIAEGRDPGTFPRPGTISEEDMRWAAEQIKKRPTSKGVDVAQGTFNINCPACGMLNTVPRIPIGDKKGWECSSCCKAWETSSDGVTKRHILAGTGAVRTVDE